MSRVPKHMINFLGIGPLIGEAVGGVYFGITGAMIGGLLGGILISSGISAQMKHVHSEGRFAPFTGAVPLAYLLGIAFTFAALHVAPQVAEYLQGGGTDGLLSLLVLYVVPALAGGIGACVPIWISRVVGKVRQEV